jgi:hypothetical protein
MDSDNVTCPQSIDAASTLEKYCGGFMHVSGPKGERYWAKLNSVDEWKGLFVDTYHQEGTPTLVKSKVQEGLPFSVEGIMVFDRGGPFEMFGTFTKHNNGTLTQVFTPFDKDGRPIAGAQEYINIFYMPGSDQVPEPIIQLLTCSS